MLQHAGPLPVTTGAAARLSNKPCAHAWTPRHHHRRRAARSTTISTVSRSALLPRRGRSNERARIVGGNRSAVYGGIVTGKDWRPKGFRQHQKPGLNIGVRLNTEGGINCNELFVCGEALALSGGTGTGTRRLRYLSPKMRGNGRYPREMSRSDRPGTALIWLEKPVGHVQQCT